MFFSSSHIILQKVFNLFTFCMISPFPRSPRGYILGGFFCVLYVADTYAYLVRTTSSVHDRITGCPSKDTIHLKEETVGTIANRLSRNWLCRYRLYPCFCSLPKRMRLMLQTIQSGFVYCECLRLHMKSRILKREPVILFAYHWYA